MCKVVCVNKFFNRACHSTRSDLPSAHPSTVGCARVPSLVSCVHPISHKVPVPENFELVENLHPGMLALDLVDPKPQHVFAAFRIIRQDDVHGRLLDAALRAQ